MTFKVRMPRQMATRGESREIATGTMAAETRRSNAEMVQRQVKRLGLHRRRTSEYGRWLTERRHCCGRAGPSTILGQVRGAKPKSLLDDARGGGLPWRLHTMTYSAPIAGLASFYATGFKDLRDNHNYGVGFGISFALGPSTSASAGGSLDNGRAASSLSVSRYAQTENDYGYLVQDSEGLSPQRQAQGEYLSPWGRVTAGVAQSPGQAAVRGGASGALVWADGHPFASDRIYDSFAVVSTGGVADVPVLYENRLVGTTDSSGHLLVPSLLSYQNNQLAVDTARLPADIEVGQTSLLVRPSDRSGTVVDFHVRKVLAAVLTLHDGSGKALPIGSVAKVEGAEDQPVGFDGQAYVTGLKPKNRMEVTLPDGKSCIVQFDYQPVKGDIPAIGPLSCK
jgi:outer membrane usher protein